MPSTTYTQILSPTTIPIAPAFNYITILSDANVTQFTWWTNPLAGNVILAYHTEVDSMAPVPADVQLPDATLMSTGTSFYIYNVGAYDFELNKFDGSNIQSIPAGNYYQIYLADNSTQAGSWRVAQFNGGMGGVGISTLTLNTIPTNNNIIVTPNTLTSSGTFNFSLGGSLGAITALASSGIAVRIDDTQWTTRVLTGSSNVLITDPDGVGGAPTFSLNEDLGTDNSLLSGLFGNAKISSYTSGWGTSPFPLAEIRSNYANGGLILGNEIVVVGPVPNELNATQLSAAVASGDAVLVFPNSNGGSTGGYIGFQTPTPPNPSQILHFIWPTTIPANGQALGVEAIGTTGAITTGQFTWLNAPTISGGSVANTMAYFVTPYELGSTGMGVSGLNHDELTLSKITLGNATFSTAGGNTLIESGSNPALLLQGGAQGVRASFNFGLRNGTGWDYVWQINSGQGSNLYITLPSAMPALTGNQYLRIDTVMTSGVNTTATSSWQTAPAAPPMLPTAEAQVVRNTNIINPLNLVYCDSLEENIIINPAMTWWQRNTSFTSSTPFYSNVNNIYTADRIKLQSDGDGVVNVNRVLGGPGQFQGDSLYNWEATTQVVNKKFGFVYILPQLETISLTQKSTSYSLYVKSTGFTAVRFALLSWTGTADSVTTPVVAPGNWGATGVTPVIQPNWHYEYLSTAQTVSGVWTRLKFPGLTTSTGGINNLALFVWTDEALGTIGNSLSVTCQKYEVGQICTPFIMPNITTDLRRALRYFDKDFPLSTPMGTATTWSARGTFPQGQTTNVPNNCAYGALSFAEPMHRIPTMTIYPYTTVTTANACSNSAGVDLAVNSATVQPAALALAIPNPSVTNKGAIIWNISGGTIQNIAGAYILHWGADAEL